MSRSEQIRWGLPSALPLGRASTWRTPDGGLDRREPLQRRRIAADHGSISIMVIGFAVIVLLMFAVVVSASRVYLTQRDLVASADAAASSAAQAVSEEAVFGGGGDGAELPIDAVSAENRVRDYVIAARLPERFDGFAVIAVVVSGTSVTVTFSATSPMPFGAMLSSDWADGYPVTAVATARSPFSF